MQVKDGRLIFNPFLPDLWKSYSFNINYRNILINIKVDADGVYLDNRSNNDLTINVFDEPYFLKSTSSIFAMFKIRV